jgi:hypothetical protein
MIICPCFYKKMLTLHLVQLKYSFLVEKLFIIILVQSSLAETLNHNNSKFNLLGQKVRWSVVHICS